MLRREPVSRADRTIGRERRSRLHARRNAGRHRHYRPGGGARRPARAELSQRVEGEGGEDPDRELFGRARPLLSRQRRLSDGERGPDGAGSASVVRAGLERALPQDRLGVRWIPGVIPMSTRFPAITRAYEIDSYGAGGVGDSQTPDQERVAIMPRKRRSRPALR